MAEFSRLIITEKGQQLISKIFKGTTGVKFTRIAASAKQYEERELAGLLELEEERQSNPVSGVEKTESAAVKVVTAFTNSELAEGYYLRAMGLFAEDPDEGEILYGVTAELSGSCYMPPFNGTTLSAIDVEMVTAVGNAEGISLEVDPAAAVTAEQLNTVRSRIAALEKDMENIEALIIPVYVQSESLAPLTSGEKLSAAFGKIAKAVTELISHLADGTRHITASERSRWNGKTATTFVPALSSGTKIGTITVEGNAADIYCEKNTDTVYTHPATSGNKHIPAGGGTGQILRWSADGTAEWGDYAEYSNATTSSAGLMSAADKA
ncbi:MAG: hypothetical protein NC228_08450, partial [[Eubacterium] siraeum]|nr:hypothetical protein [[Eubacterium] siraeum]